MTPHAGSDKAQPSERKLPEAVELAWGLRAAPRRGPRPSLTTAQVAAAAVAVADKAGLSGVSMQSVAEPLGVVSTALYRYVESKETLLALCVDAAIGPPPRRTTQAKDWRERVHRWCTATAALYRRHPWLLDVQVTGMPVLPNNLMWMEQLLGALVDSPVDEQLHGDAVLLIQGHVHNLSALIRSLQAGRADPGEATHEEILAAVVPRDRYPAVAEMFLGPDRSDREAATSATTRPGARLDLTAGVDIILDGLESRRGRPPRRKK